LFSSQTDKHQWKALAERRALSIEMDIGKNTYKTVLMKTRHTLAKMGIGETKKTKKNKMEYVISAGFFRFPPEKKILLSCL